jgi:dynein heavy chain 2
LDRVARFNRVLSQPGGHLLLAGKAGVGRRTTTALVAYAHDIEFFSPKMTPRYDDRAFRADLKRVLAEVGLERKETLLYLEDHQLVTPGILETVNSLLSSGEVPGLFTNAELEQVFGPLKEQMMAEGSMLSPFEFFTARVRAGTAHRAQHGPGGRRVGRAHRGEPRAVHQVLGALDGRVERRGHARRAPDAAAGGVRRERRGRRRRTSSSRCARFNARWAARRGSTSRSWTSTAASSRASARSTWSPRTTSPRVSPSSRKPPPAVAELSGQAAEQQTLLAEKQQLADEALSRITVSMSAASERKKEVESLKEKTRTEEKDLSVQKAGIEDELKDVQPLIDSARAAVGQIKSDNINEIKSLRTPPEGILAVLEAVLLLMNNPDTSWAGQKKFLGSRGVKEEIINFDAHVVTAKNREIVRKILKEKEELFEHKNILRVSVAAAPLAAWVKAQVKYSLVLEKIAPLEKILGQLSDSLGHVHASRRGVRA